MFCKYCGSEIKEGLATCSKCGKELPIVVETREKAVEKVKEYNKMNAIWGAVGGLIGGIIAVLIITAILF